MGFFDPAWKKVVARSPSWFAPLVQGWEPWISEQLRQSDVTPNGYDLSRSVIYGLVALNMHRLTGAWSPEGAQFVSIYTTNANKGVLQRFRGRLYNLAQGLWTDALLHIAYPKGPPAADASALPQDGLSFETAIIVRQARDNTAAVAALLRHVTHDQYLHIRNRKTVEHSGERFLVIEAMVKPLLGPSKDYTFHFRIDEGEVPGEELDLYMHFFFALP